MSTAGKASLQIKDFFEAEFKLLRPEEPLPCPIYLYFALNQHILCWRQKDELITTEFINLYLKRGVTKIWILLSDKKTFELYLNPPQPKETQTNPVPTPSPSQAEATPPPVPARTERGALMAATLQSPKMTEEQKKAILGETAKDVLQEATAPQTPEEQKAANKKAWDTVQDILDSIAEQNSRLAADVWKLAKVDPELEHSVNVATYTVIFALAFGKIDQSLISDLALAGLLHDLGLSQVRPTIASRATKLLTPDEIKIYSGHVMGSISLMTKYLPSIPERVKMIVLQHHEKFDGTGYPQRLSGFKIDDVAQLVGMADFLDTMSTGHWDGTKRTFKESFDTLEGLEKARTFPEFFNPDVFAVVVRWLRKSVDQNIMGQASQIVGNRTQEIVGKMNS